MEGIRAETPTARHSLKNLSLTEIHTWQIIAQQAPRVTPQTSLFPRLPADKPQLHPQSGPSGPIRLRRVEVKAKKCPGGNETHRQNETQGEARQMDIWFGCGKNTRLQ